jgi:hypothetical protein
MRCDHILRFHYSLRLLRVEKVRARSYLLRLFPDYHESFLILECEERDSHFSLHFMIHYTNPSRAGIPLR